MLRSPQIRSKAPQPFMCWKCLSGYNPLPYESTIQSTRSESRRYTSPSLRNRRLNPRTLLSKAYIRRTTFASVYVNGRRTIPHLLELPRSLKRIPNLEALAMLPPGQEGISLQILNLMRRTKTCIFEHMIATICLISIVTELFFVPVILWSFCRFSNQDYPF
jgi:hypothetical protein